MGLLDQLSSGLLGGTDPTAQLGLSILAANQPSPIRQPFGGILGRGVFGAQQQQTELTKQRLLQMQLMQQQQEMQAYQSIQDEMARRAHGQQAPQVAPQMSAPPGLQGGGGEGGGSGGDGTPPMLRAPDQPQQAPQQPQQAPQQSARNPWDAYSQEEINGLQPPNELPVDLQQRILLAQHQDPSPAGAKYAAAQRAFALQQTAPKLQKLDNIIESPYVVQYLQHDPGLQEKWQQIAPQIGLNPNDPKSLTSENVRTVLGLVRGQIGASVGAPEKATPHELKTNYIGLGGSNQTDYLGKISAGAPQQATGQFVIPGKDGQPPQVVEMLKSQGIAQKLAPFNSQTYAAASITDQALEQQYQRFKVTGEMPAAGRGGAAMQAKTANYFAKRADQDGDTGAAQAARSQQFKASQGVIKDFESGDSKKQIVAINTAVKHIGQLPALIDALGNGNLTVANRASNFFKDQTGSAAPGNLAAMKEFAMGEVAKAVLPGGGGEAERSRLGAAVNEAKSPQALKSVVKDILQPALAGKTDALRQAWDVGTNGQQGSFDKFLLPETKKALGIASDTEASSVALPAGWAVTPHQ